MLSYKNLCKSNISVKSKQTDPDDYYDYVMFSFGNCSKPDKFIMEQFFNGNLKNNIKANRFFKGVRFYFLYKDIINEKDFIMDGYHSCKVKNKVSLVNLKAIVAPEYMKSTLVNSNTEKYLNKMVFLNSNYNCDEWARHAYQAAKAFIYKNPL